MHARDFTPGPYEAAAIARHKALRQKLHPAKPPTVLKVVPKEAKFVKIKIPDPFAEPVVVQPPIPKQEAPDFAERIATIAAATSTIDGNHPCKSVAAIEAEVLARHPGITPELLRGKRHHGPVVAARHELWSRLRAEREDLSFRTIGLLYNRDRSTIIQRVQAYRNRHGIV